VTGDRDLLCALFAQQLGLAPADAIFKAGGAWLHARTDGGRLSDVLVAQGVMDPAAAKLVEGLVDEALTLHQGDAKETLKSLPPAMQHSLSSISATLQRTRTGEEATFDSLETPENIGTEARGRYSENAGPTGQPVELGRGGVGRVIVVRDQVLQRDVAMKELLREITTNPKYDTLHIRGLEARFLREARVTGQLEHPAVVPVYELGRRRDGTLYFTMQRVKGRTLAQALADARSLEGRLAFVPDLLTVCRAIASAHYRGVIHRDLKPQNIMLGSRGETFVMDWGLARVLGRPESQERPISLAPDLTSGTEAGPVGTPSYMSPEQAWGEREQIDQKSDVWGLGALLFELLTGRAPFVGPSPWEVLAEVRSDAAPKVLSVEPEAPPELAAICDRALQRRKEDRYESAEAMAKDLEAWLAGQRVSAYEYTVREVVRRLVRRHRALSGVAAAALAGLLVVASVTGWRIRKERDEARAMATFFLKDVRKELARSTQSSAVLEQLSHSALEVYSDEVDVENGPRDERVLLVEAWIDVAITRWQLGKSAEAGQALAEADRALTPLERQFPDDPDIEALRLVERIRHFDLVFDAGQEEEGLEGWLSLRAQSSRVASAMPQTAERLSGPQLLESRLATILGNRQRLDEAFTAGARAVSLGEARLQLAPGNPLVLRELSDDTVLLGSLLESRDERARALATFERGLSLLREARARRDSSDMRRAQLNDLRLLVPLVSAPERRAALLKEARRLAEDLLAINEHDAMVLLSASDVALFEGDAEAAWDRAGQLEGQPLGSDYEKPLCAAAFAAGRDDVVLAHVAALPESSRTQLGVLVTFAHALSGRLPEAAAAARQCELERCARVQGWYAQAFRARATAGRGAGARALLQLVDDVGTEAPTSAEFEAAWQKFSARLAAAAKEAP
jgi:tRNA A-37 threonylcarbamoyl transferase component Bud32/tetratricopeptide (TPR) repeat protein